MTSEEIRARIAEYEAEAERRVQADAALRRSGASAAAGAEDDPWDRLFDAALLGGGSSDGDEFSLTSWLAEGMRGLRAFVRSAGLDDEFWEHMHAAEREFLLAWRALIDARLRRWEERERANPPNVQRRQSIDVEFDS
jgi:hypothetical protein